MSLRRSLKNAVNSYSVVECDVRAATCNEDWSPNAVLLTRIAQATYDEYVPTTTTSEQHSLLKVN